jgi:uncharacterized membrane protein YidH (DUF202 family)
MRTAIALAALGFVVARFNLFVHDTQPATSSDSARYLGVALVVAAALVVVVGFLQHRQVSALLARHGDLLPAPRWPAVAGAVLALLAIVAVGIYLATSIK